MQFNNTNIRRKNPINRNPLFYSEEDYLFEQKIAQEHLLQDINQTIVLYQVDYEKTNDDDIYHEAQKDNIRFKTPVELNVIYEIEDADTRAYEKQKQMGLYAKPGNLKFGVMEAELKGMGVDIKRGDFIGILINSEKMEFFEVVNDGRVNWDNRHSQYGFLPLWRECLAIWVDPNTFTGK